MRWIPWEVRDWEKATGYKVYTFNPYKMCGVTQKDCDYIQFMRDNGHELYCTVQGHLLSPDAWVRGKIKFRCKEDEAMYKMVHGYYKYNDEHIKSLPLK